MKYELVLTVGLYISLQLTAAAVIKDSIEVQIRPKKNVMHVIAQKAGGSWKSDTTQEGDTVTSEQVKESTEVQTVFQKPYIPIIAQKAGGTYKHQNELTIPDTSEQTDTSHHDSEFWDDEYDDEEIECPPNKFFHIRSKLCVPYKCRRGTTRNKETGQCIKRYIKPPPYNNYIDYVYRPSVKRVGPLIQRKPLSYKRG